ncbi:cytochrome P450 [Trichoderma afarasin]
MLEGHSTIAGCASSEDHRQPVSIMATMSDAWVGLPWAVQLIATCVVLIVTVLITTYINSLSHSWPAAAGKGHEPPIAPYWLPGIQHLAAFLRNPARIFRTTQAKYKDSPFTLLMGGVKFHVFGSPSTAIHVFARSRTFAYEPVTMSMLENGLNLPVADRVHFQIGLDRANSKENEKGFVLQNHNVWLRYLSGEPLDDLMQLFTREFHQVLEKYVDMKTRGWQTVDLYEVLRKVIFDTSVITFFGPRLAQIWGPTMWEDFCLFNDATYIGVRTNLAYVLQPRAGRARERMLRAFEEWLKHQSEGDWPDKDKYWNEEWGAKMNWERDGLARQFGLSLRGRATMQASFLFAIVLNAAPMSSWFTWVAASNPDRLAKCRAESLKFLRPSKSSRFDHELEIDAAQLRGNNFMQTLWKEALRIGTAASPARVVMEDTELEGYVVRKGSVVLMPTALLHHSDLFPRSDQVDTERWTGEDAMVQQRSKSIRTFGGGMGMCSGRHAAEQELIGLVSKIITLFDIEFEDSWKNKFHFDPRSLGIMHPAGPVMVRLKRREL